MTPSDVTLLVMAGGLGSRFGGDKQLVDVGPNGETFLDYAIRDALAAGIGSVVVVARTDLDALLAFEPQPESGGGFDVHLLGDALASRNVHAAIHDARRLCQVL